MSHNAFTPAGGSATGRLLSILVVGAVVTTALAGFGVVHQPNYSFGLFGVTSVNAFSLKSKIATGILGLALVQLILALWIYGRLPGASAAPRPVRRTHRAVGTLLFLATLPVAVHCAFAYGVKTTTPRVTVHSLAGCFFYGAFVAKILVVRSRGLPGWVLPTVGGLLVTLVAVLWYTSALWFLNGYRLPIG